MQLPEHPKIGVVGLGYVGMPLVVAFATKHPTIGFDINSHRVEQLNRGHDATGEVEPDTLAACTATFTNDESALRECNTYIITVPTPIDDNNVPLLRPLESASAVVGKYLQAGDVVVYESTVYPGATEEVCVPILEQTSGLVFNGDFSVGYSPERINPGD